MISAIGSALLAHENDAVGRPRYAAAQVNEVALNVDFFNANADRSVLRCAIVAGHLFALDDTRRICARADGTRPAVLRVTVRVWSAVEAVALYYALEPTTFARAGDFHLFASSEDFNGDGLANLVGRHDGAFALRVINTE